MAEKIDCIIVSGAPNDDIDFIKNHIVEGAYIIAADSGYKKLEKIGIKPDVIVADFDSSDKPEYEVECDISPIEKDSTDTFNAVKLAVKSGYNNILILGALGGRLDHTYSNLLCLDYAKKHGVKCVLQNRNNRISLITDEAHITKEYKWFSLFAFLEPCKGIKIKGAHYTAGFYDAEELDFDLGDQLGQSNFAESDDCTVSLREGTLLLIEADDYV